MSDIYSELSDIKTKHDVVKNEKVARFSYTNTAYTSDDAVGVEAYSTGAEQNVPKEGFTDLDPNVLDKGIRSQAASLPRNSMNHFFGRVSYNLNKVSDWFNTLLTLFIRALAQDGHRYTVTTKYQQGDWCTMYSGGVVRFFMRISSSPGELSGAAPLIEGVLNTSHWDELKGAPATITPSSSNSDTGGTHSHAIDMAALRLAFFPVNSQYPMVAVAASNAEQTAFPDAQRPAALFGGIWTPLWDTDEVAFMTRGLTPNIGRTDGLQLDAVQDHDHYRNASNAAENVALGSGGFIWNIGSGSGVGSRTVTGLVNSGRTASTTRPRNRNVLWFKKDSN